MFRSVVLLLKFRQCLADRILLPALLLMLFGIFLAPGHTAPVSETMLPPTGRVVVTGSIALANLTNQWVDDLTSRNPAISITVADPGGAVGIEALLNGSADVVLASRLLSQLQMQRFTDRFGYAPAVVPVAMDGVAVYVNILNPLRQITLTQLDAIYSTTLRCGASRPLRNWGELGVKGQLGNESIAALGLTAASGAYLMFKHVVLCDGDFRADFQALVGPAAVEAALADNVAAIGFSSSALRSADILPLAVAKREGQRAIAPGVESIQARRYPLTRVLAVILNIPPGGNAAPAVQAFLNYARSAAGQEVAAKAGYVPLPIAAEGWP